MKFVGFHVLKEIVKARELSLGHISKLLAKRFDDRRDYYTLASLITSGYVDAYILHDGKELSEAKSITLETTLYTMTFGRGEFEYMGMKGINEGDFSSEKFLCTGKGDLYFAEVRQKRIDRIVTLVIGVVVGIISAISAAYFAKLFR